MRVALATRGRQQIEIIEPVSGLTGIYTQDIDFSASDIIFHHVGIAVTGGTTIGSRSRPGLAAKGQGFKLLFPPEPGPDPVVRYGYVDTRKWCGHYTEYLWWSDAMNGVPTFPDKVLFGGEGLALNHPARQRVDRGLQDHRGGGRFHAFGAFGAADVLGDEVALGPGGRPGACPQQQGSEHREVAGIGPARSRARGPSEPSNLSRAAGR